MRFIGSALASLALVSLNAGAVHAAEALHDVGLDSGLLVPHVQRADRLRGLPDTFGAGVCVLDANRDLWPDLLILSGSGSTRHYGRWNWWSGRVSTAVHINIGGSGFIPVPLADHEDRPANAQGCSVGDLDNDGDDDLVITTIGRDQLWRNDGNGDFTRVTDTPVSARTEWTTGATLVDVNGDGLLDLYVGGFIAYQQNARVFEDYAGLSRVLAPSFDPEKFDAVSSRLYINKGDFRWDDATGDSGIANHSGRTIGTYWLDVNGDLKPDLVELNTAGSGNRIHVQQDDGRFLADSELQRTVEGAGVHSMAVADLDRDPVPDLVFGTGSGTPLLLRNTMEEDVTWSSRATAMHTINYSTWGVAAGDFDNDGETDLFAANGLVTRHMDAPAVAQGQRNDLLLHAPGGYRSVQGGKAIELTRSSRTAVSLDHDNNGTLDLYVANNNGPGQLLASAETPGHWIQILPRDDYGHKGRVQRISVRSEARTSHAFGPGIEAHLGTHARRFHFGLGKQDHAVSAEVTWFDGSSTTFRRLAVDRLHLVAQSGEHCVVDEPRLLTAACAEDFALQRSPPENPGLPEGTAKRIAEFGTARAQVLHAEPPADNGPYRYIVEREYDAAVAWLILNLRQRRQVCSTAATLIHLFDEEEAAVRTKYTAVSHLAAALDGASDSDRVCLLRALGHSERYRANRTVLRWIGAADRGVREAAIIALGRLRQTDSLGPLRDAVFSAPVELAAEAAVSLEQIAAAAGRQAIVHRLAQRGDEDETALRSALIRANRNRPVVNSIATWIDPGVDP